MFDNYGNSQPAPAQAQTPQKVVRFDRNYVKTLPGILKIVELLCNFIGFICIKVSWSMWLSAIFFNILYWLGNIVTAFLFVMYMFHLVEKYDQWPWLKLEFFFCCAMALAYVAFSVFATAIGEGVGYAVGFFGLCAIIAYGMDGYLKYKGWRRGLPPQ